jgi:hypothetical protein
MDISRPRSVDVTEKRRFDDVLCVVVAKNKSYLGPHVVKLKSGVTSKYGGWQIASPGGSTSTLWPVGDHVTFIVSHLKFSAIELHEVAKQHKHSKMRYRA